MSISTILMYAELHSNIGHISIIAALETPCNSSTKAEISSDGQQFLLRHDGKAKTLNLPGAVSTSIRLEPTALGSKELTWRLPLAGRPGAVNADSSDAPWPAKDLNEGIEFLCRGCGGAVMSRGSIKEWKDLPSENWAEMMDFWHCHKPTVPEPSGSDGHSHDDPAMGRGYGAHTKFSAQPKIGFVDLTTVLFAEEDCLGVEPEQATSESHTQYQILLCRTCKTYIGHVDAQAEGYRLYKWRLKSLSLNPPTSSTPSSYQPSTPSIITAQLQSIMLAQSVSMLLLVPLSWKPSSEDSSPPLPFLHLWIINPSLRYSSTSSSPQLAMKIFYRVLSAPEARELLRADRAEEVTLHEDAIREVAECLRKSGECLPPGSRRFQGWDVGLLERFEGVGKG